MTLLQEFGKKLANRSSCRYKISAIAVGHANTVIGYATNLPRWARKSGGYHAEMRLMHRYGQHIKKIYIFRVNKTDKCLPIHPCCACQRTADKLGIKIYGSM